MKKSSKMWHTAGHLLAALALTFILAACSTTVLTPGFNGDKIQQGYRIPIASGEHSGSYRTDDLGVNYHYIRDGDALNISGTVDFASGTQLNFRYIDYFNLGLLIADSEGLILANHALTSTSWVNLTGSNDKVQFSERFRIPMNATIMAFTYTGQASEGGMGGGDERGGGNTQFWQYPVTK